MRRYSGAALAAALAIVVAFPLPASASGAKTTFCHGTNASAEGAQWRLISVGGKAADRHAAHGDPAPGDAVPGEAGYVFDDTCTPQEAAPAPSAVCLDHVGSGSDLYVANLGSVEGIAFLTASDPIPCRGTFLGAVTGVAAPTSSDAAVACGALFGTDPAYYSPLAIASLGYPDAPANWWLCP